ncbi:MAG TPA: carboxypeptidase regulatory-like domain-containing protein [Candidatus Bathyarchaeia archaeon]|nr:carboxypeptidase regulatory-like domain-containing protein [Candidatus Bathyarchaeia archaeon]
MQLLHSIETFSEVVWPYVFHATWQSMLAGALILGIVWLLRNRSASLRYALLILALVKFAVPPLVAVPIDLSHWTPAEVPVREAVAPLPKESSQVPVIDVSAVPVEEPRPPSYVGSSQAPPEQPQTPMPPMLPAAPQHHMAWHTRILALHLAGAFVACLWILGWTWRIWAMRRRARMVTAGPLYEQFLSLCAELDLSQRVDLFISEDKTSPIAFGLFRPKVLMPASIMDELSTDQLGSILAHELAHLRRWDLWVIVFENLLLLLWWFNPVFWLVMRALRRTREDCCDDLILHLRLAENTAYCESLVRAASSIAGFGRLRPAVGTAEMLHPLGRRMKRIMDVTLRRSPRLSIAGAIAVVLLGLAVLPGLRPVEAEHDATGTNRRGAETVVPEGYEYLMPQLEPGPYRLHGTVRDQNGAPAAGVKVAVFRGEAWQWGYKDTFTADDGTYEITGLPDGAYNVFAVTADAFGAAPLTLGSPLLPDENVSRDLTLTPFDPDPLEGTVLSKTGEPVPGTLVLSIREWSSYGMSLALQIRTDQKGRFAIPRWTWPYGRGSQILLPPTLAAFAERQDPGVLLGKLPEGEPLTLVLDDGVRVSGTVCFKDSGKPARGIPVMLRGTPADNDMPDITTRTDESGRFVFERLCPFQYQLVIYDAEAGYTALEHPRLNLLDGQDVVGLDMQISHGATISGKVTFQETGEPIPAVRLWVPNVRPPTVLREAVTGSDGTYRLQHLPAGEFAVAYAVPDGVVREPRPSDIGPLVAKTVSVGPDEQLTDVDFTFERGACVSGRVVDQAGDPVKGARLHASNSHRNQLRPSRRLTTSETVTAEDGAYCLWGLAPSEEWTYQLVVSADGYGRIESDPFQVTGEIDGKDFVVQRCATISGRVVDSQGRPVPTVAVSMKITEGRASQRLPDALSDVEGRFAMREGACPGTYTFELCTLNMGFGPYRTVDAANPPLRVEGPDDIEGIELVLPDEKAPHDATPAKPDAAPKDTAAKAPEMGFSDGVEPIPAIDELPGRLVFHGRYVHRSRGREYDQPSSLWVKEQENGAVSALSHLTFFNETALAVGDENHRPAHYAATRKASDRYPAFQARIDFHANKAVQIRHWGEETDDKEFPIDEGALFSLNSRPDPYAVINVLIRGFGLKAGEGKEFIMCDWGNGPHGQGTFPSYRVRVENKGKEEIVVPAGAFNTNHLVLTQLTSADTWFKKRAGHVTDLWVLDNHIVVRIVRHREPYEVELLDYDVPDRLPGQISRGVPEGAPLEVLSAEYGAQDKWVDVTEPLKQRIQGNKLTVSRFNDLAGDPIDGVVKELKVKYRVGDQTRVTTVREGETLELDIDLSSGATPAGAAAE